MYNKKLVIIGGKTILKQTRNTKQRELVLKIIKDHPMHPTADEIYNMAREIEPKISHGTVYRNLNLLADMGKIRRLSMTYGPVHYDFNKEFHYHFLCRKCNKIFDTPIPYDNSLNQTPENMNGFKTEWHRLLLIGLCPGCLKLENDKNEKTKDIK